MTGPVAVGAASGVFHLLTDIAAGLATHHGLPEVTSIHAQTNHPDAPPVLRPGVTHQWSTVRNVAIWAHAMCAPLLIDTGTRREISAPAVIVTPAGPRSVVFCARVYAGVGALLTELLAEQHVTTWQVPATAAFQVEPRAFLIAVDAARHAFDHGTAGNAAVALFDRFGIDRAADAVRG